MFKTRFIKIMALFLSVPAFLLVSQGTCPAFMALDDQVEITGFLRNDSAVRIDDNEFADKNHLESGDVALMRNWLQIEAEWFATDNLRVFGMYRGWYDAALDFNDDLEENFAPGEIENFERGSDIREYWVQYTARNWSLRAGKQQIVWGESDGLRMADIINPLDYSWHYFFPSWEDIRVPLWAAKFNYMVPNTDHSFEFVWLPNAFDNGFEGIILPPAGSNWAFPGTPQVMLDAMDASSPDKSLENSEFGIRYRTRIGGWDISIFDFYSRSDDAIFKEDWLARMGAGNQELFQYPWVNKLGATFNMFSDSLETVFRGECVYTFDEPHNASNVAQAPMPVYEEDTFAYMLGFDRPTMIPWLNSRRAFFISGQLFQKFDTNKDEVAKPFTSGDDHQTILTLVVNTAYLRSKLSPQIFMLYDFSGEGWVQPQLSYVWGAYDEVKLTVGANIMLATNDRQAYFGPFDNDDEVYATLLYEF